MNNSSPFGQSLQGSRSFQNNTQSAPQQMFGGFQPQQSFGGFGGGQGFGGFNPFQGGYGGGFQPQQQFNPFQGGYGGGFQPQGFGGGFNPMFGGIGGLGFNPMMGPQFSMPMQGFNPYQRQLQPQQPQQNPFVAQDAELTSQMQNAPEYQAFENARKSWEGSEGYKSYQQKRQDLVRQMQESQRQPMYGGIGGLGFNPMMGPQFGMPMQGFNPYQIQMMDKQRQFEQQQFNPYQQQFQPQQQVSAPWMPTITETPGFGDWQQKQKQWVDQTPEGISYTKANEALEAFKKANPNPFSYSEFFGGDPALRAQYAQLHGAYQKAASPYFNKLNEYEKTNPFSPTAQQPQSPFTGPQRSAQDILSMAPLGQFARMFGNRMPQGNAEPQRPAPPGMKWWTGMSGQPSLVPAGLDTSMMD